MPKKSILRLLIDADMFAYRATAAVEHESTFGNISYLHTDIAEAQAYFTDALSEACNAALDAAKWSGEFKTILCFSGSNCFRKQVLPDYKANRKDKRKPLGYYRLLEWCNKEFICYTEDVLEADDLLGICGTSNYPALIISGDKDLKSIPCPNYNFLSHEYLNISQEDAYYQFLYQTLVGDATDNYKGCPKVGSVGAKKLLDANCSWTTVVSAYLKAGLSEEVALQQARVAHILHKGEYDKRTKEVTLWTP